MINMSVLNLYANMEKMSVPSVKGTDLHPKLRILELEKLDGEWAMAKMGFLGSTVALKREAHIVGIGMAYGRGRGGFSLLLHVILFLLPSRVWYRQRRTYPKLKE